MPHEKTNAESFYYKKQMDNRTPMVIVLQDGEELKGIIEWYDRSCIKLHRESAPNLLVHKHNVKYLKYWFNEADGTVFCLSEAPDRESALAVHREAHGLMPDEVIEVKEGD